ncbi:MAG: ribonuclease activity regulator protein RraA [Gammaproteobacteria bacterium]|nr:ribonuclease activity regulator protein RraA [Gammaproteobacteria bacterium]|tara:strand:+ start:2741 stop:3229 length:489 start_codon:yes stop_codon:yes gene_type:complete
MNDFVVADLCDQNDDIEIIKPIFQSYGLNKSFSGKIKTVKVHNDNSYIKKLLENDGDGFIMVVDGGGSLECALMGDNLAEQACKNNWKGILINGCIRDSEIINTLPISIKALNTCPIKSIKNNKGEYDSNLSFGGVTFINGNYIYSDSDGIIISTKDLLQEN